jgi:hypothetical protein
MNPENQRPLSLSKKITFAAIPALLLLLAFYSAWVIQRTTRFYLYYKNVSPGAYGNLYLPDPVIGAVAKPGARGYELYGDGKTIQIVFDENGFRVPANRKPGPYRKPLVLALGCSFTFGDGVEAENTFAQLVADALGGTALNAGINGTSIANMLVLAERLIPKYQPDYVLVQFSGWLVDRAQSQFRNFVNAKFPSCFLVDSPDDGVELHPPAFGCKNIRIDKTRYVGTPKSLTDYLSFFFRVGLPLYIHDDANMAIYYFKLATGILPKPAANREKIVRVAYMEIARLCRENHSRMVIVILHDPRVREPTLAEVLRINGIENATVVDTGPALISRMPTKSAREYYTLYGRMAGSPPVLLDNHPNELAHKIIAEEILKAIAK